LARQLGVSESLIRKIEHEILAVRTPAGGWTADQLAQLGIPRREDVGADHLVAAEMAGIIG
jgi:hypothetical protein